MYFYPRSPCGERPFYNATSNPANKLFLSTLSLRRATVSVHVCAQPSPHFYPRSPCGERRFGPRDRQGLVPDFYPRSPCGERPNLLGSKARQAMISIHALLAESDFFARVGVGDAHLFLSTLSLRRATLSFASCFTVLLFLSTLSLRRATC